MNKAERAGEHIKNSNSLYLVIALIVIFVSSCCKPPASRTEGIDFSDCVVSGTASTFEIVTFNIKTYPAHGEETAEAVAQLLKQMDADIIALQEISSMEDFNNLADRLIGWEGLYYPIDNSIWNLAYLYKISEVSIDKSKSKVIFEDDFQAFPRPPFEIHATHMPTGLEVIILNNHFKCCGGSDNEQRRRNATDSLHRYISDVYPDEEVIILGDLNDEIDGTSYENNVFWTMVNDSENFKFTDMSIARGSMAWWSYPSWPSHIDHICVTDELFSSIDTIMVFRPDQCYPEYPEMISDHRPVILRLK